jgi:hypothetical protein
MITIRRYEAADLDSVMTLLYEEGWHTLVADSD